MHEICDNSTPLWILPFSTSEKSCFTQIIVAKLSFRILNFLIPIPTKLLYFYIMTEFMCFILFANRFLNKVLNGIKTFYPVREQVSQRCYCFLFC